MSISRRALGMSLIEVVVFIVVLAIGIAGTLVVYNQVTSASVDPMVRKQVLEIASSLLEEIELRGFTYCDPDAPNVYTAGDATAAECGGAAYVENIGPDTLPGSVAETRYFNVNGDPVFDNVNDYHGFSMSGATMKSVDGTVISDLANYSVSVSVANAGTDFSFPNTAALLITVTASHTLTGTTVSLQGYRLRYAPNSP